MAVEDDGMSEEEFREEMLGLEIELKNLQEESNKFAESILHNLKELKYDL